MRKRLAAVLMTALLLAAGCTAKEKDNTFDSIQIDPGSEAARAETVTASLYFADESGGFLVGESRTIDTPVNDRVEVFIMKELIAGPSDALPMSALINPNTRLISVSGSGDVFTVVLSAEFLSWPFDASSEGSSSMKQLAVYSVVNTLVEASGYPRIQLLVDADSSGAGQRIKHSELGMSENGVMGPLERNGECVLTPGNTVREMVRCISKKEYAALFGYIAHNDAYGYKKPDETVFIDVMSAAAPSIEGYSIGDTVVSDDGQSAVVMLDYTIRLTEGETVTRTGVPAAMVKESGVWRQRHSVFTELFLSAGEET